MPSNASRTTPSTSSLHFLLLAQPLTPSKYIEFVDHDLDIDYPKEMSRIQDEMRELLAEEKKSQAELEAAFKGIGYGIE